MGKMENAVLVSELHRQFDEYAGWVKSIFPNQQVFTVWKAKIDELSPKDTVDPQRLAWDIDEKLSSIDLRESQAMLNEEFFAGDFKLG